MYVPGAEMDTSVVITGISACENFVKFKTDTVIITSTIPTIQIINCTFTGKHKYSLHIQQLLAHKSYIYRLLVNRFKSQTSELDFHLHGSY